MLVPYFSMSSAQGTKRSVRVAKLCDCESSFGRTSTDVLERVRSHVLSGTTFDALLVADDLGTERLGETTSGLSEVALEVLDDAARKVREECGLLARRTERK